MLIEAPSEAAVVLYHSAIKVLSLSVVYSVDDVDYVVKRLRAERFCYAEKSDDWTALGHMIAAISAAISAAA